MDQVTDTPNNRLTKQQSDPTKDKPNNRPTKQQTNQASQLLVELRECELTFMGKIFLYFVKQKNYCMQLNN